jgi:peroxiredoxin
VLLGLISGCTEQDRSADLLGNWLFNLELPGAVLPFNAQIVMDGDAVQFYAINGDEQIHAEEFLVEKDSFFVRLPVFNTALIGKVSADGMTGNFHDFTRKGDYQIPFKATRSFENRFSNLSKPNVDVSGKWKVLFSPASDGMTGNFHDFTRKGDYQIPFKATRSFENRFSNLSKPNVDVSGKWKVLFSPASDGEYEAIGVFEQLGAKATGTFLTTTGDYRYLEGNVSGDSLFLSCFDGSHAFLFKARITADSIFGDFWSGNHWRENWTGARDESFKLPDPSSLTFLKPGYTKLDFKFENLEGETVSLSDQQYNDKVVIVQIMGSWCPNCKDETAYLVSLHEKFHDQGLEVISLAFEKSDNKQTNIKSLERLRDHFGVPYEILIAGTASKKEAGEKLPMLNHVLSFPTSIFIGRNGEVRKIHTGFSGPGTGEYYQEFVEETDRFVTRLLIE